MSISTVKKALSVAVLLGLSAPVMAETTEEWGRRVLELQANLDAEVPLAKSLWVGTHNSFANPENDSMIDYNHRYSLKNQLRRGVRELVFDVHWYMDQMVLCHNNLTEDCLEGTTGNRKLSNSLDDIKEWLNEANNKDQVVLLKLEMTDKARRNINKIEHKILGNLGSYVFRADSVGSHGDLNSSTGCTAIPSGSLTKKQVLDAGKNVIIFNTHSCISDGGFNNLVFYGDNNLEDVNDVSKLQGWSGSKQATVISRAKDAMTRDRELSTTNNVKMKPSNVADWMRAGLNIFETYGYDASNSSWNAEQESPIQAEHMVWSWNTKEPNNYNGNEDCAMVTANGKLNDWVCSNTIAYACQDEFDNWLVTDTQGAWSGGFAACAAQNATFRVPTSLIELDALNTEIARAKGAGTYVWVNYADTKIEGEWLANKTESYLSARDWKSISQLGGSGGSSFDDKYIMQYDLYRTKRKVTKISMSAGNRVDKIGFNYSDGHSVSHGGNGFDRYLTLGSNEYISKVKVCSDNYNGSNRIHYLQFVTNYGNSVQGGTSKGTCRTTYASSGYEIFAMFGRSGNELDAVGFYQRRR